MLNILNTNLVEKKSLHFNELIDYIFLKNKNNKKILLQLDELKDTKDLFCFCLDLFCKGMVILYGNENRKVNINELSMEQIQAVVDNLSYAGIFTIIQIKDKVEDDDYSMNEVLNKSLDTLLDNESDKDLSYYKFTLKIDKLYYIIQFDVKF